MRKLYVALASAFFSLSMCITGMAAETQILVTPQDTENASGMLSNCDCSYCDKIEEFFAGEQDALKRELSVQVWKASIHPELFVSAGNAVYVGTFPNADDLQFTSLTLGLDQGWPRCRVANGNLKVYMPPVSGPSVEEKKKCVDEIYKSVMDVKEQINRDNADTLHTLFEYYRNEFGYSGEYVNGYVSSKLSTVFENGKACCTGYCTIFKIAANMCGIPTAYVGNNEHMFIETQVDGVNKYIDLAADKGWGDTFYLFGEEGLYGMHSIQRR